MQTHEIKYIETIDPSEITSLSLSEERDTMPGPWEAALVTLRRAGDLEEAHEPTAAQVLYAPEAGRAGVSWGADATWTDCRDIEDAAERVLVTGEVLE